FGTSPVRPPLREPTPLPRMRVELRGGAMTSSSSSTYRASDGAAYERFLGRWSRLLAGPFAKFAGPADHGRVLDLGCGTGSLALALAERGVPDRAAAID